MQYFIGIIIILYFIINIGLIDVFNHVIVFEHEKETKEIWRNLYKNWFHSENMTLWEFILHYVIFGFTSIYLIITRKYYKKYIEKEDE